MEFSGLAFLCITTAITRGWPLFVRLRHLAASDAAPRRSEHHDAFVLLLGAISLCSLLVVLIIGLSNIQSPIIMDAVMWLALLGCFPADLYYAFRQEYIDSSRAASVRQLGAHIPRSMPEIDPRELSTLTSMRSPPARRHYSQSSSESSSDESPNYTFTPPPTPTPLSPAVV